MITGFDNHEDGQILLTNGWANCASSSIEEKWIRHQPDQGHQMVSRQQQNDRSRENSSNRTKSEQF